MVRFFLLRILFIVFIIQHLPPISSDFISFLGGTESWDFFSFSFKIFLSSISSDLIFPFPGGTQPFLFCAGDPQRQHGRLGHRCSLSWAGDQWSLIIGHHWDDNLDLVWFWVLCTWAGLCCPEQVMMIKMLILPTILILDRCSLSWADDHRHQLV